MKKFYITTTKFPKHVLTALLLLFGTLQLVAQCSLVLRGYGTCGVEQVRVDINGQTIQGNTAHRSGCVGDSDSEWLNCTGDYLQFNNVNCSAERVETPRVFEYSIQPESRCGQGDATLLFEVDGLLGQTVTVSATVNGSLFKRELSSQRPGLLRLTGLSSGLYENIKVSVEDDILFAEEEVFIHDDCPNETTLTTVVEAPDQRESDGSSNSASVDAENSMQSIANVNGDDNNGQDDENEVFAVPIVDSPLIC